VGTLQTVLARRVVVAAWRLARADRLAAGTGLGPRRRTERGWGPIPQPVRRRPTRRPTGRAVRAAELGRRCQSWPRHDPGRQRHEELRDPAALSRRGDRRVLARAQDAQGAPGRAGRAGRRCRGRAAGASPGHSPNHDGGTTTARPASATGRTRARRRTPTGIRPERAARAGSRLHETAAPWLPNEPEAGNARHAPAAPACRTNPRLQPPIGQTIAADGAQPTAASLLQGIPDGPC
jgi:hypothetical protein